MGNRVYASGFAGSIIFILFSILLLNPSPAAAFWPGFPFGNDSGSSGASAMSQQAIDRLCERQSVLGSRLVRPLIDPDICNPPPSPEEPTLSFSADPTSIEEGESSTLSWDSDNADTCTASNGWSGTKNVSGEQDVSPDETTTYELTCEGEGGEVTKSVTVTVTDAPLVPTLSFSANPTTVNEGSASNATSTLSWDSANATSCTASNGWSGSKAVDGTQIVQPTGTTSITYTLECAGAGGSIAKSVTVTVTPEPSAPTLTLVASSTSVTAGATTTLAWASTNTTSCTASNGWNGAKALSGNEIVTVTATTTYELDCDGPGGSVHKEVTVNTTPTPVPSITFTADPLNVLANSTSTLTWSSQNTALCIASNGWTGTKATSGTQDVTPSATSTYALSCGGVFGTTTASVTVNVSPHPLPVVTLTANPTNVTPGEGTATTTLTWTSTNATSCTAFLGWTGSKALSGSEVVTPSATTTYQLDCTGLGGVGSDDAVVTFTPTSTPPAAPTLSFSANPTTVNEGSASNATSTLSWDSEHADTCMASEGWSGSKAVDGTQVVTPTATTTYVLDCSGPGGSIQATTTVNFVAAPPAEGAVLISEVLYDAASTTVGAESANEWIEVYNGTDSAIDLMGWSVGSLTASTTISESAVVASGAYAVIAASTTPAGIPGGVTVVVLDSALNPSGLSNTGDAVFLRNSAGTVIDAVSWGTNTDAFTPSVNGVADGHSIARLPVTTDTDTADDWEELATPTPGE